MANLVRSLLRAAGQRLISAGVPVPMFAIRLWESALTMAAGGAHVAGLPPPALRMRVAGSPDPRVFTHGGELAIETLTNAAQSAGRTLDSFKTILDFGCGCGRVLRLLRHLERSQRIGVDVDPDGIAWCKANFAGDQFLVCDPRARLPIDAASIDLCYAFSVFTHLNIALQDFWLDELHRLLATGGLLVCSTHGPACRSWLTRKEAELYDAGQIVVRLPNANTSNLCNSFHPANAFRAQLAERFRVVSYVAQGARGNAPQDLWVLEKLPQQVL